MLGTCMGNRGTIRHTEVTGMQGGHTRDTQREQMGNRGTRRSGHTGVTEAPGAPGSTQGTCMGNRGNRDARRTNRGTQRARKNTRGTWWTHRVTVVHGGHTEVAEFSLKYNYPLHFSFKFFF